MAVINETNLNWNQRFQHNNIFRTKLPCWHVVAHTTRTKEEEKKQCEASIFYLWKQTKHHNKTRYDLDGLCGVHAFRCDVWMRKVSISFPKYVVISFGKQQNGACKLIEQQTVTERGCTREAHSNAIRMVFSFWHTLLLRRYLLYTLCVGSN